MLIPRGCLIAASALLFLQSALAQVKLAPSATFELFGSTSVEVLTNAQFVVGDGTFMRQTWQAAADQQRTYSITVPTLYFQWNEIKFSFVAKKSGTVKLTLLGPYELVPPSTTQIYQEEVFWDALSAEGATVPNGSFEIVSGTTPQSWTGGVVQVAASGIPPVSGSRYARTWNNRTLSCTLNVTADVPVVLQLFARPVIPAGFPMMTPVPTRTTAAHQAALRYLRGVNLGNYLEMTPGSSGILSYTDTDLTQIKSEGFDHIRVPVGWHLFAGAAAAFQLSQSIFQKTDFLVTNANRHGLSVILDWHHFDVLSTARDSNTNEFYAIWRQVAQHYANGYTNLALELLNEPLDTISTLALNPIYAEAIRQIRTIDQARTIFVGPAQFNSADELNNLDLPDDEQNVITTIHCYDPYYFTHQGAEWALPDTATTGVIFPGPPPTPLKPNSSITHSWVLDWIRDYNYLPAESNPSNARAFAGKMRRAKLWSDYFGRPLHVGEFGCYYKSDAVSRVNFYRQMVQAIDAQGLGWAMWDWKAGFHYIQSGQPEPTGMRTAIFQPLFLKSASPGLLQADSSIGKNLVIQRSTSLTEPVLWQNISTQMLVTPNLIFQDPSPKTGSSIYRILWLK